MTEFTPWLSLLGGMMIGFAALILMATNGRIAGISGIVSRLLPTRNGIDTGFMKQGLVFVVGLLLGAPVYAAITGKMPAYEISNSVPLLVIGGLLVGFGAVLGSGCTSGHGVCGISRFSVRSIIATLVFMATAFVTVLLMRHF